jgi:hypothetical protein
MNWFDWRVMTFRGFSLDSVFNLKWSMMYVELFVLGILPYMLQTNLPVCHESIEEQVVS